MNNKRLTVIIVVILVVAGCLAFAKWIASKKNSDDAGTGESSESTTATYADRGFPLKKYSSGDTVTHLQRWLNATGNLRGIHRNYDPLVAAHDSVSVDGKFGNKTENALMQATGMKEVSMAYYTTKNMANF